MLPNINIEWKKIRMPTSLEYLVDKYKILVDTCSLMHNKSKKFFLNELFPVIDRSKNRKISLPLSVLKEIEKFINKNNETTKYYDAIDAIDIIDKYGDNGLLDIYGDRNEPFTDALFLTVFNRFQTRYNMVLITQDENLARDIYDMKRQKSVERKKKIGIFRITRSGRLQRWYFSNNPTRKKKPKHKKQNRIPIDRIKSWNEF